MLELRSTVIKLHVMSLLALAFCVLYQMPVLASTVAGALALLVMPALLFQIERTIDHQLKVELSPELTAELKTID